MKAVSYAIGLFLLLSPLLAQDLSRQAVSPEPQREVKPADRCTVEGIVTKTTTGEPLKKAWLVLHKSESREQPFGASSDTDGHFVLKDVDPGRYRLYAERNGYARQEYGQRSPNRPGTILTLSPGQQLKGIVFRMIPGAAISGRVSDEDGEPLAGVNLQALRSGYMNGQRQLVPTAFARSDDLGQYRIYGLSPGQYYVSANPAQRSFTDPGPDQGYVPTYYPGTNEPGQASPVPLRAGDETAGIDFNLMPTRTVHVRGRVVNSIRPDALQRVFLSLIPRLSHFIMSSQSPVDPHGGFTINGVRPGSYTLYARWYDEGKTYGAQEQLEVGNTDVEGVNLVIGRGSDLNGRLRVAGDADLNFADLRIFLRPLEEAIGFGGANASIKTDGTFVLSDVAGGTYRLQLYGAPEDFYLKAARAGEDDVLENGLNVTRGLSPGFLEVVLSPAGGRIDGTVVTEDQKPFSGAQVILIPEPRRRTRDDLYKTTNTDQDGRFTLRGIAPGEYKLFAWEDVDTGAYRDPDFLRPYEDRGKAARVEERALLNFQLQVISATENAL